MYPHRIHLHGPWQPIGGGEKLILPPRGNVPVQTPPARLRRTFRWPTALMPFERLWLMLSSNRPVDVSLNGQSLGAHTNPWLPFTHDLTSLVQSANTLELGFAPGAGHGVLGPVYLEVRRDVHLTDIVGETLWDGPQPRLRLTARRVGEPARPLSLVIRLDDREVLYQDLPPSDAIEVVTPPFEGRRWAPGRQNVLHQLDCQLLDPACVLSQHGFMTGFRKVDALAGGEYCVNDVSVRAEAVSWDEPLDESASLAEADRAGRLLVLPVTAATRPYVWHHPSVLPAAG